MFVGANTFAPFILESEDTSSEIRHQIAETSASRGVGQLRECLGSAEDVIGFMDLVRIKWEFLSKRPKRSSSRR